MIFHPASRAGFCGPCSEIKLDGHSLCRVSETKFLGVLLDDKLTWKPHINLVRNKMSKAIGILSSTRHLLTEYAALTIYHSLNHSHLSYCAGIWATNYISYLQPIRQ